jgi:uncharacterized protein (TIGR00369 family)
MNDKPAASEAEAFDPAGAGWEMLRHAGFAELTGPLWKRDDGGRLRFGFVVGQKHLNYARILHGGMLTTLADLAMGMTAWRATGGKAHATIELNMQFVSSVRPGEFVEAQCEVVRAARSVVFMQAKMFAGARIVAAASGIWKILQEG